MTDSILFRTPPAVAKKINRLYLLLLKEKNLFEQVASQVNDKGLRSSILSIAQQNNQYAVELSSHLQTTGSTAQKNTAKAKTENPLPSEGAAIGFCNSNEKKVIVAYNRILKEAGLYDGLRKMIHYQLTGVQFACTQLKLLSSVKQVRKSRHFAGHGLA